MRTDEGSLAAHGVMVSEKGGVQYWRAGVHQGKKNHAFMGWIVKKPQNVAPRSPTTTVGS